MDITRTWYAGKRFVYGSTVCEVVHIGFRGITYKMNNRSETMERYSMDLLGRSGVVRDLDYADLSKHERTDTFRWICGSFGLTPTQQFKLASSEIMRDIILAGAHREWGTVNVMLRQIGLR